MKENFPGLLDPYHFGSRDPSEIFSFDARNNLVRDYISGTPWSQTYAGTNRNRTNSAGLLEAVAANTPVIDYVSGVPMLRLEPAATYYFLNSAAPATQDCDVLAVKHTVCLVGAGSATISAGTATIAAGGAATDGTPFTVNVTGAGTITVTIAGSPTRVWLTNTAMAHSYVVTAGSTVTRTSEANTVTLAMASIPKVSTMLAAGTGTIVIKGRFAFARAAGVVSGILSCKGGTGSIAFLTTTAGNISSNDDTTYAESTAAYTANTNWKIVVKFPSSANKYRIGADIDGAGIVWGPEANFDGAFTMGTSLILGYSLHGPIWTYHLKALNTVLADAQINAM